MNVLFLGRCLLRWGRFAFISVSVLEGVEVYLGCD